MSEQEQSKPTQGAEMSPAELKALMEKQRETAANDWLQKVSALLNRKVTGFMLTAVGPNTDGSIGVDRLGIVMGEIAEYRVILAEADVLYTQIQNTLMRMPVPPSAAVPPLGVELVPAAEAASVDKAALDQHNSDFSVTEVSPAGEEPAASGSDLAPQ